MVDPSRHWDAACASSWDKWFHVIEAAAGPLSARMLDMAGVASGQHVLDIATGLGEPAVSAARRVGPEGSVLGIDLSADMLGFARRRAAGLGLGNIAFHEMDANELGLNQPAFDAALSRWGLMFMSDLAATLADIRRCLMPGGALAAAVWGPPERAPSVSLSARVIRERLGMAPPDEGALTPFALCNVEAFLALLRDSGFRDVEGEWVPVEMVFESAEKFTEFRWDRSAALRKLIVDYPEKERDAAWRAVTEAARGYEASDGSVRMTNQAFCAVGRN